MDQRLDGEAEVRYLPRLQIHLLDVEDERGGICDSEDLPEEVHICHILPEVLVGRSGPLKVDLGEVAGAEN